MSHHLCCHLELNVVQTDSIGDFGKGGRESSGMYTFFFPDLLGVGEGATAPKKNEKKKEQIKETKRKSKVLKEE